MKKAHIVKICTFLLVLIYVGLFLFAFYDKTVNDGEFSRMLKISSIFAVALMGVLLLIMSRNIEKPGKAKVLFVFGLIIAAGSFIAAGLAVFTL